VTIYDLTVRCVLVMASYMPRAKGARYLGLQALVLIVFLVVAAALVPSGSRNTAYGSPASLFPTQDSEIWQLSPDANFGSMDELWVASQLESGQPSNWRSIFMFDVSGINEMIVSAQLVVHVASVKGDPHGRTYDAIGLSKGWTENSVTWNMIYQYFTSGSPSYATIGPASIGSSISFDVTDIVQGWISGVAPNFGIGIWDDQENSPTAVGLRLYSREEPSQELRPALVISTPEIQHQILHETQHWQWYASDSVAYNAYLKHRNDVEAFFDYPEMVVEWITSQLGPIPFGSQNTEGTWIPTKWTVTLEPPGGGASGGGSYGITIPVDAFYNFGGTASDPYGYYQYWAYVYIQHETANAFTGAAVSGGWPVDWWSNGKSPYPFATGALIGVDLNWKSATANSGSREVSLVHLMNCQNAYSVCDPGDWVLVDLFYSRLYGEFGAGMFRIALAAMRNDQIALSRIGGNPSALRTDYVAAYLSLGTGQNIASLLSKAGVGRKPSYYTGYWPGDYAVLPQVIQDIMTAHANLQALPRNDPHWDSYTHGDYAPALAIPEFSGTFAIVTILVFLVTLVMLRRKNQLPKRVPRMNEWTDMTSTGAMASSTTRATGSDSVKNSDARQHHDDDFLD
jgi:hypothetical protein